MNARNQPKYSKILRDLRGARTQEKTCLLAEERYPGMTGIITTALSHWENGRRTPPPLQLHVLILIAPVRPSPESVLTMLTELAAREDVVGTQYRALLHSWGGQNMGTEAKVASFHAWASTHLPRPARRHLVGEADGSEAGGEEAGGSGPGRSEGGATAPPSDGEAP